MYGSQYNDSCPDMSELFDSGINDTQLDSLPDVEPEGRTDSRKRPVDKDPRDELPLKIPKLSIPRTMEEEARRVVDELIQAASTGDLVHSQRVQLFRAIIAVMVTCSAPTMLEKEVLCFSVHAFAQAVVDAGQAEADPEQQTIAVSLESSQGAVTRVEHEIPIWIVPGLKLYFLEVRPHFMPATGISKWRRRFVNRATSDVETVWSDDAQVPTVQTQCFFVNSTGKDDFRVRTVVQQFKDYFDDLSNNDPATVLKRQVI